MKIAVYAIAKNEFEFVDRFLNSAQDADYIVVGDTGSTDGTLEKLQAAKGVTCYPIHVSPWRFDVARNAVLSLVPADAAVCVSLDLDEVLTTDWWAEIERVWTPDTTRLRYGFNWGAGITFPYEKIHARHGYRWHHPCHEYPVPDHRIREVWALTDKVLVEHYPDPNKSRGQYLELLEVSVKEDPACPRNRFYYSRELTFYGRWKEAVESLLFYLQMPAATWEHERCYAMRLLGRAWSELGDHDGALHWYRKACAEAPNSREPWCDLAEACYRRGAWGECYSAATSALKITDRELVYTCDPEVWGSKPWDYASISAWNLGLKEQSLHFAEMALSFSPEDPRLAANVEVIRKQVQELPRPAVVS